MLSQSTVSLLKNHRYIRLLSQPQRILSNHCRKVQATTGVSMVYKNTLDENGNSAHMKIALFAQDNNGWHSPHVYKSYLLTGKVELSVINNLLHLLQRNLRSALCWLVQSKLFTSITTTVLLYMTFNHSFYPSKKKICYFD